MVWDLTAWSSLKGLLGALNKIYLKKISKRGFKGLVELLALSRELVH